MASGFLVAEALAAALRRPYHQGNSNVTTLYLVEGLKIGQHRVMLKRNFNTACWVPPVGKRDSHSIYYGDRMVENVLDHFCEINSIALPANEVLIAELDARLKAEHAVLAVKLAAKKKPIPGLKKVDLTMVYDAKIAWMKNNLAEATWDEFLNQVVRAVAAFGRHERCHARESPTALGEIQRDLKLLGIPFRLWNLFEDARIEHISRAELAMPFGWLEFEKQAKIGDPVSLFFRCIQLEGASDVEALGNDEPYSEEEARTIGEVAQAVQTYYQRACRCKKSEQLFPIMKEFLEEFKDLIPPPAPPNSGNGEGGEGSGGDGAGTPTSGKGEGEGKPSGSDYWDAGEEGADLTAAAQAAEQGDDFFEEFEKDADIVGGTDKEGKKAEDKAKDQLKGPTAPPDSKSKSSGLGEHGSITPSASGGRAREDAFLATRAGKIDEVFAQRVENLYTMLMRMFRQYTLPQATEAPGRRMSGRHLAHGELKYIHRKVFGGKSKRKYTIVYDCSSSMRGYPDREGKVLLLALNKLAKAGYLQGSLILSGYVDDRPGWLQYEFPVADEVILRINPSHGSEGLQHALKDNLKHIKGTDDVFVYTDANICDSPINRAFFAKQRVWAVGLYCGTEQAAEHMMEHFPQNIIRHTIEEVVETMLTRNRRTAG